MTLTEYSYQASARHVHAGKDEEPVLGLWSDGHLLLQVGVHGHPVDQGGDHEEAWQDDQVGRGHRKRAQSWATPSLPSHIALTLAPSLDLDHLPHSLHILTTSLWLPRRLVEHCRPPYGSC